MYLIGIAGGWKAQEALWKLIELDESMCKRTQALMAKYQDMPMDLADASLVAVAETLNLKRIFTLDSDFHVYRFKGRQAFEIIP